jgi:hypothetical protein
MPKKGEKSPRMSQIAQARKRGEGGRFKKLHDVEAGIIVATCLPTRKQYVAHSLDVWDHVHKLTYRMRNCKIVCPEFLADIQLYGLSRFRVGIAETIRRYADETDRDYLNRLHVLYSDYICGHKNIYKTRESLLRSVPVFERKSLDDLGKTKGNKNYDLACEAVYVLTCKPTMMHHVGISGDFDKRWRYLVSELNTNSYKNLRLQGDWNEYGANAFTCDYVRSNGQSLQAAKKAVQARLGDLHCY